MASRPPPHNRKWTRDYFKDHPKLHLKHPSAYAGVGSTRDKARVFCKQCLERRVTSEMAKEADEVNRGVRQSPRTRELIEEECMYLLPGYL